MNNLESTIKQTLQDLEREQIVSVKKRHHYKFADDKVEARKYFEEVIKMADKSIKEFVWYPEYDHILDWMVGSDKGLLLAGDPGVGKSNIIKYLIPVLFSMKYEMRIRPIQSDKIKESWDIIENSPVVIIDEVGDERQSSKYGIKFWAFEDVVKLCENESKNLFITTNFSKDQIEARYGTRIIDRLDYLVTAIRISGESLR